MLSAPSLCDEMDWMSFRMATNGIRARPGRTLRSTASPSAKQPPWSMTRTSGRVAAGAVALEAVAGDASVT